MPKNTIEIRFYGPKSSRKWRKSDIDYRYFYTFVFNSDLYSVRDKEIIKYETIGNNELKEREICTIPNDNTYWEFLHHYARNTMVTNGNLELTEKSASYWKDKYLLTIYVQAKHGILTKHNFL